MSPDQFLSTLDKEEKKEVNLISLLEGIQAKYGYLSEEALRTVAEETGRSLVDVYGVATFYKAFSLKPRGKHLVSVCLGTACHVNGGPAVAIEFERQLNVKAGETTEDREFTLVSVACLGACALGPVVVVDGHYFSKVTVSRVEGILKKTREGLDKVEIETDQRVFPVEVSCSRCNHSLMDPSHLIDGFPSIRVTVSFDDKHGWVSLSCLYGSYKVSSEYPVPDDKIVLMFCPHCHAELIGASKCTECSAPMVPMIVRGGGGVQICSRRGCKGHMLDLGGAFLE